jgi:hypothetical protein
MNTELDNSLRGSRTSGCIECSALNTWSGEAAMPEPHARIPIRRDG